MAKEHYKIVVVGPEDEKLKSSCYGVRISEELEENKYILLEEALTDGGCIYIKDLDHWNQIDKHVRNMFRNYGQ